MARKYGKTDFYVEQASPDDPHPPSTDSKIEEVERKQRRQQLLAELEALEDPEEQLPDQSEFEAKRTGRYHGGDRKLMIDDLNRRDQAIDAKNRADNEREVQMYNQLLSKEPHAKLMFAIISALDAGEDKLPLTIRHLRSRGGVDKVIPAIREYAGLANQHGLDADTVLELLEAEHKRTMDMYLDQREDA